VFFYVGKFAFELGFYTSSILENTMILKTAFITAEKKLCFGYFPSLPLPDALLHPLGKLFRDNSNPQTSYKGSPVAERHCPIETELPTNLELSSP
jgi:hypothetical protein